MVDQKLKVAIISHAQVIPEFQNRWKRLALDEKYEVHILIPEYWEQTWFGEKIIYKTEETNDGDFYIHPFPTTSVKNWARYFFKSVDADFKKIKPDLIYIIQEEGILIHHQIYLYRKLFAPDAKIIFFSMNARGVPHKNTTNPLKKIIRKWLWNDIVKNTDAALVHYPGCLDSLRKGGYTNPIFIQTQVGVDDLMFAPNSDLRNNYRNKFNFKNKFVIGYSGRLTTDKGVDDLVSVFITLAKENNNLALLLVGNGDLRDKFDELFAIEGLSSIAIITGFVDQSEVPGYMNAMDVFVLGSITTPHWIDTFPLVTVQAQAVGLPVIASDSASIPWQLGNSAIIFSEGDRNELKGALFDLIGDVSLRESVAKRGRERCLANFCHIGMTDNFTKIASQVMNGAYIFHEKDELYTQWKAY